VFRVQHASKVACLDSLQGQSGNQSSTYTATVLSGENLNGVLLVGIRLLGPVKNLPKSLGSTSLEVGVLVEDGAVSANMARLVILLLADGSNTTSRKARSTSADKFSKSSNELQLGSCTGDAKLGVEQIKGLLQILKGIPSVT
jgi:hypothetical protein